VSLSLSLSQYAKQRHIPIATIPKRWSIFLDTLSHHNGVTYIHKWFFHNFFFVRDKINPRDTWIRWHLGVMSRTFVPPSSAQQRKGRLGIKTSRRYDDVSVLTFQVTVYKISRDLPVKTERTYLGYLCLGVITPRDDMESVWYLLGVISIGCANVSE
jgi:hypothetical protein